MSKRQDKVYAIVNRKGGVGKSTTAITLAHGLARRLAHQVDGRWEVSGHVLLIDLDPQSNCATILGLDPGEADIGALLAGRQEPADSVISADRSEAGFPRVNLWLIPSSTDLVNAKQELILANFMQMMTARQHKNAVPLLDVLETRLGILRDRFDYILIDCPPNLDALSNAVYHFADAAIVPVKVDYLSAAGAAQHVSDIRQAQMEGIAINIDTIVPTFFVPRQLLDRQILAALQETYGAHHVAEPIPKAQAVAEAPAFRGGATLYEYAPDSPATLAYEKLVERIYHNGR